jgi:hypothetical protein
MPVLSMAQTTGVCVIDYRLGARAGLEITNSGLGRLGLGRPSAQLGPPYVTIGRLAVEEGEMRTGCDE